MFPFSNSSTEGHTNATTYVALIPWLLEPDVNAQWNPASCSFLQWLPNTGNWTSPLTLFGPDDTSIVQCDLTESYYNLTFRYINGIQSVSADIVLGNSTLPSIHDVAAVSDSILRRLSYQSVMDAFNAWILGSVHNGRAQQSSLIVKSSILTTRLLEAREMRYLRPQQVESTFGTTYDSDLQSYLERNGHKRSAGLSPIPMPSTNQSLVAMLQESFVNLTISLMSSAELQLVMTDLNFGGHRQADSTFGRPNLSSVTAPPKTTVTHVTFDNVYIYSAFKLWIAYSLALAFTALAVTIGLFSMYFNQASYRNSFSTILRTAKNAEISVKIEDNETDGANPLPKHIGEATVEFPHSRRGREEGSEQAVDREAKQPLVDSAVHADRVAIASQSRTG